MNEELLYLWMGMFPRITNLQMTGILEIFDGMEGLWNAKEKQVREKLAPYCSKEILKSRSRDNILRYQEKLYKKGIKYLYPGHPHFPESLLNIPDCPRLLYAFGKTEELNGPRTGVAIVGARRASPGGLDAATSFAARLSSCSVSIISGMAAGVDGASHRGSLSNPDGFTVAVLGSGIDVCYPRGNIDIYQQIKTEGVILSEYGPDVQPLALQFPQRNRIISGLAKAILVIEAKENSGSLITADAALEQGRDVFVVPGNIYDKNSKGCNNLIRQGATLVTCPEDIIQDMKLVDPNDVTQESIYDIILDEDQNVVYKHIGKNPIHIEELCVVTGLKPFELFNIIYDLKNLGAIKEPMKGRFMRR